MNGFLLRPIVNITPEGRRALEFHYQSEAPFMKKMKDEYIKDEGLQADLILASLCMGITQITEEQWKIVQKRWNELDDPSRIELKNTLVTHLSKAQTSYLADQVAPRLWAVSKTGE